jgi:hypothetical protein
MVRRLCAMALLIVASCTAYGCEQTTSRPFPAAGTELGHSGVRASGAVQVGGGAAVR